MLRKCPDCGHTYNDFNHYTTCPHTWFFASESARASLLEQGIDPDTGDPLPAKQKPIAGTVVNTNPHLIGIVDQKKNIA